MALHTQTYPICCNACLHAFHGFCYNGLPVWVLYWCSASGAHRAFQSHPPLDHTYRSAARLLRLCPLHFTGLCSLRGCSYGHSLRGAMPCRFAATVAVPVASIPAHSSATQSHTHFTYFPCIKKFLLSLAACMGLTLALCHLSPTLVALNASAPNLAIHLSADIAAYTTARVVNVCGLRPTLLYFNTPLNNFCALRRFRTEHITHITLLSPYCHPLLSSLTFAHHLPPSQPPLCIHNPS